MTQIPPNPDETILVGQIVAAFGVRVGSYVVQIGSVRADLSAHGFHPSTFPVILGGS